MSCKLGKNENGLYDLTIMDGAQEIARVRNVTFARAVVEIEDHMYTRRSHEA